MCGNRCSTSLFGDLTKSDRAVDGIFGFGQHGLSVISQLSSRRITPKIFSHCLKGEGSGGGILVLGEILDPRIVYTPLVPSQYVYLLYASFNTLNGCFCMTSECSLQGTKTAISSMQANLLLELIFPNLFRSSKSMYEAWGGYYVITVDSSLYSCIVLKFEIVTGI